MLAPEVGGGGGVSLSVKVSKDVPAIWVTFSAILEGVVRSYQYI